MFTTGPRRYQEVWRHESCLFALISSSIIRYFFRVTNDLEEVHDGVYSENADDMMPAINALATTNPNLAVFDMDTVPTNDNVVNAIASAFPQLTSFSVTNGAFGVTVSDAVLDALRASHPGITITIRTWSEDE